jgi:hypothetical protein
MGATRSGACDGLGRRGADRVGGERANVARVRLTERTGDTNGGQPPRGIATHFSWAAGRAFVFALTHTEARGRPVCFNVRPL